MIKVKSDILLRTRILFLVLVTVSLVIAGRLFQLQYIDGDKWRKLAQEKIVRYKTLKAARGSIFAEDGSLMATSLPFYKVTIDPTVCPQDIYTKDRDSLAFLLSSFYKDQPPSYYLHLIHDSRIGNKLKNIKPKRFLVLNHRRINYHEKKKMMNWPIFREGRYRGGLMFESVDIRYMPFGSLAQRTIGFINSDKEGAGLEFSFDKQLAGRNGKALFQKVSGGYLPINDENRVKPVEGHDIETTIDINLQDMAHNALLKSLELNKASYGCVILMEVKTGEIKAMVNLGKSLNANYIEDYNYALGEQGLTEPGSTFKLASMIALLEKTNLKLTDSVNTGNGVYKYYKSEMRDVNKMGYGTILVRDAFEKSSNIGISKKVQEYFGKDPKKYLEVLHQIGITRKLGFQMVGEALPYFKTPEDKTWSGVTLPWMSIGYELKLSPIHTLALYNAIANNGTLMRPFLVKRIKKANEVLEEFEPHVLIEKICTQSTLEQVESLLRGVVERGTAKNLKNETYSISGKTGTSQRIENGRYIHKYYTSFVGFFPSEEPIYSGIVVIDQPSGIQQTGSGVAAPVFKEISDKVFAVKLDLHKKLEEKEIGLVNLPFVTPGKLDELKDLCNKLSVSNHINGESEWAFTRRKDNAILLEANKQIQNLVPNVYGMNLRDALFLLEQSGLNVLVKGVGRVKDQSIKPGTRYMKGETIILDC